MLARSAPLLALGAVAAQLLSPVPAEAPEIACTVPQDLFQLDVDLPNVGKKLRHGQPLKIVALGSSSTAGAGVEPYPSFLEKELKKLGYQVTVINSGVGGQEIADMYDRLQRDVIDHKPDLVIIQLGTNAVINEVSAELETWLGLAIKDLRAIGVEVVVMDPQYAPKYNEKPGAQAMVGLIAGVAKEENVGVIRRNQIMQYLHEAGMPFDISIMKDGLHTTRLMNACVGKFSAWEITTAALRPMSGFKTLLSLAKP